jgi:hypothetical protein
LLGVEPRARHPVGQYRSEILGNGDLLADTGMRYLQIENGMLADLLHDPRGHIPVPRRYSADESGLRRGVAENVVRHLRGQPLDSTVRGKLCRNGRALLDDHCQCTTAAMRTRRHLRRAACGIDEPCRQEQR